MACLLGVRGCLDIQNSPKAAVPVHAGTDVGTSIAAFSVIGDGVLWGRFALAAALGQPAAEMAGGLASHISYNFLFGSFGSQNELCAETLVVECSS